MAFDQVDTVTVFGSSRDSAPAAVLGQHTPPGTVWVRTLVVADNIDTAVAWLENVHLLRPIETLQEAEVGDWVGQAVARHARVTPLPDFHALIYLAVAAQPDLGRPTVLQLDDDLTGWLELGYVGFDDGPCILPAPDAFTRPDRSIPLTCQE
jgi:hypothetical protein